MKRLTLLFILLFANLAFSHKVSCRDSGAKTYCRIEEPYVRRHLTEYTKIKFADGDLITINAGGCVQTGGSGKTWKRYVDPIGANSDQFYHGLIWVPGATAGLERIQGYNNKKIYVKGCGKIKPENQFLRLGYEDDDYGDNNYNEHDDGTEDQCKDSANAYVDLEIEHNGIEPLGDVPAPLDLERPKSCEDYDPNLLPLNPRWGWQGTNPPELPDPIFKCTVLPNLFEDSRCSSQHPAFDLPSGINSIICGIQPAQNPFNKISGHVDYFPAVYTGVINWDEHSSDDDYNFNLVPWASHGLTVNNDQYIGVEFDSDETIDYFNTRWWNLFHRFVDFDNDVARRMITEKQAIVAGLVGLDCQHDCRSEIHPVFALAMQIDRKSVSSEPLTIEETWTIFVRNTGNEGFCSSQKHYLYLLDDTFSFLLPQYGKPFEYSVLSDTVFEGNNSESAWSIERYGENRLKVIFLLPQNQISTMIHGELHFKIVFNNMDRDFDEGNSIDSIDRTSVESETPTIENQFSTLLSRNLTKEQLEYYYANTKHRVIKHSFRVPMVASMASVTSHLRRSTSAEATRAVGASLHDSEKEARDKKRFEVASKLLGRTPKKTSPKSRKK